MDDPTANKSHIPAQSWTGQNGWSTTATQGSLFNPLPGSQHLSLGLSSFQRPSCDQGQMSSQSSMTYMNTSPSTHHSVFKPSHNSSVSNALFANSAIPRSSHCGSYVECPQNSSVQLTANQGKNMAPLSFLKSTQASQPCQPQQLPSLSANNLYKTIFHRPSFSQDLPSCLSSCAFQGFSTSQATSGGVNVDFAGVSDNILSRSSTASQGQRQWMSSSHCRGAKNQSVPDSSVHPHKETPQEAREETVLPLASDERQRSILLHQHTQLQQVADSDKCMETVSQMETVSPDDSSDVQSPQPVNQIHPSVGKSSPREETTTSETQQVQQSNEKSEDKPRETCNASEDPVSEAESEKMENLSEESEEDGDSEYLPNRDLEPPLDSDSSSSAESSPSSPSVSADEKPSPVKKRPKLAAVCLSEKICATNLKKASKTPVLARSKSKDKHVYTKKNYCLFCSKPICKMSRHLEMIHSDKTEVAAAFQYPPNSKERLQIWNRLIKEGNFVHNKIVLKTGKGVLAARRRVKDPNNARNLLHCLYCRGLYMKNGLTRHMKSCSERKGDNSLQFRGRSVASHCVLETSDDLSITSGFKKVLSLMTYNKVMQTVMADELILQYGELLLKQSGSSEKRHDYIRQNLRQIARLVLQAQEIGPLMKLEDFFLPSNFPHVVSAVNILAGYDAEEKKYTTPSLAIKLGYSLQKVCSIVEEKAAHSGDASLAESAQNFLSEYQKNWRLISGGALKTLRKNKLSKVKKVPAAQDVRRLSFHVENAHLRAEKNLRDSPSLENYVALVKVILTRTLIFNRRKCTDISSLKVTDFMSRKKSEADASMDISVSDLERRMCGHFMRIDIQGRCGRLVPVFLKPTFISAIELFLKARETCGVPSENPFLFARPAGLTAYRGVTCIQEYVEECGAGDPQVLTLKKIRKHYTTMLQLMNLDENVADQILGPNNQVRTLRRDSSMQVDDVEMYLDERLQLALKATSKGAKSGNKQKWEEAEIQAVERHMMRFIKGYKVPQKNDCIVCLEAETEALKNRSWKGVKNYVRNRITAQKCVNKSGGKKVPEGSTSVEVRKHHKTEQQMSTDKRKAGQILLQGGAKVRSGAQNKGKYKWGEAEVLAVERHMMHFIEEHRIPQKNDCTRCLEAEPEALRNRSWKGVKDYVRNRITALSRQAKSTNSKWRG